MNHEHHFRVLRLSALADPMPNPPTSTWSLEEFKRPTAGVNVFYLHGPYLRDLENRTTLHAIRNKFGSPTTNTTGASFRLNRDWWDRRDDFEPKKGQILSLFDHAGALSTGRTLEETGESEYLIRVRTALGKIHTSLRQGEFDRQDGSDDNALIIFAHASARSTVNEFASVMAPSTTVPGLEECLYYEYLLWDDSALWAGDQWPDKRDNRLERAWFGTGWSALQLRQLAGDGLVFSPDVSEHISTAISDLVGYGLLDYPPGTDLAPKIQEIRTKYIDDLCQFLPDHLADPTIRTYLPTDLERGSSGAPLRVSSIMDLTYTQRQLLLDGWLTPWLCGPEGQERWIIQPGSLALLHWAGRNAIAPYPYCTLEPRQFMEGYRWDDPCWFGGNLGWRAPQRSRI